VFLSVYGVSATRPKIIIKKKHDPNIKKKKKNLEKTTEGLNSKNPTKNHKKQQKKPIKNHKNHKKPQKPTKKKRPQTAAGAPPPVP
jgi:hypothetical protein